MNRCHGRIALLTGGASGIGAVAARMLAAEGAKVMVSDLDAAAAKKTADAIGASARGMAIDVTSQQSWMDAARTMAEVFGGWNVLVNCAGIMRRGSVESSSLAEWKEVMDVNVSGCWRGCRIAVANMDATGGSIINVSSIAGLKASEDRCAFDASHGAIRLLTKSIALYCAERGQQIRCNSIHGGVIETPQLHTYIASHESPDRERSKWDAMMPQKRRGEPEDIGHMVVYLASEESRLVTGAEMVVDGGSTAR